MPNPSPPPAARQQRFPRLAFPTVGGLLAILLWSTTFAIARSLAEQVGALTAGASVYLAGAAFAFIRSSIGARGGNPFRELTGKYLLGCGSLFVLYTALIYAAVGLASDRQQLLEIALVNYFWPAATILFSVPLLGKRANFLLLPGTALALLGIFLVLTQGSAPSLGGFWGHALANPLAYGFGLTAAISWALYSNFTRRWSANTAAGGVTLFVTATGLVLLALRFLTHEHSNWTLKASGEALVLGVITTLGYGLWDLAMRKGDLVLVASASYFTPLLSTSVSCLYLQVVPGARLWWGCLMVISGTLLSWRSIREGEEASGPAASSSGS